jgi:hypothetical protein
MAASKKHRKTSKKRKTTKPKSKRKVTLAKLNTRVSHIENFLAKASAV